MNKFTLLFAVGACALLDANAATKTVVIKATDFDGDLNYETEHNLLPTSDAAQTGFNLTGFFTKQHFDKNDYYNTPAHDEMSLTSSRENWIALTGNTNGHTITGVSFTFCDINKGCTFGLFPYKESSTTEITPPNRLII